MLYPSSLGNNTVIREYALALEQATFRLIIMVDSCLVEFFHVVMMINSFPTMDKGKGCKGAILLENKKELLILIYSGVKK